MASKRGSINGYCCDSCREYTYIVHVDDGVTPMFLACRAEGVEPDEATCKGRGTSLMYPRQDAIPVYVIDGVLWEWYCPDAKPEREFDRATGRLVTPPDPLSPGDRDHVEKGGLFLRLLTDDGRAVLDELLTEGPTTDDREDT